MAKPSPLATNSPVLRELEETLAKPEPMCLVIISVEGEVGCASTTEARLRENMRSYDHLWSIDDRSWALMLKTLADTKTMTARVDRLFLILSEPHLVGEEYVRVRVQLGASVRLPQDTSATLLERIGAALAAAEAGGCIGPVMR